MTLTQIEYALAVYKHKNFSKAAKSCHVTQPTLSAQIQKLEEELGIILFDRDKQPIRETIDFKKIYPSLKRMILEQKQIIDFANDKDNVLDFSGEIKIAILPTLSPYLTPKIFHPLSEAFPKAKIHLYELTTQEIISSLQRDELDLAILITPLEDTHQFFTQVLFYEPFLLYCSKKSSFYKQKQVQFKDLGKEPIWLLNEGHCFRNQVMNICHSIKGLQKGKKQNFEFLSLETGQFETLRNIVKEKGGITLIPYLSTEYLTEKDNIKHFSSNVPVREVSLISDRFFEKESILKRIQDIILKEIPSDLHSPKKKKIISLD
ncbi:LysR substrate-binding domain-containing protein [Bacteriovoracaceae bacterium]|nr:LysR substrate-binding domain-containing protein [Bacteriovoracaceae bacterium]